MLWSPVYETGVPIMDSQHQELFRQIDVLLDNPDESTVGDALDFLGKYVIQHFSTEEELQTRSKYPKYPPTTTCTRSLSRATKNSKNNMMKAATIRSSS